MQAIPQITSDFHRLEDVGWYVGAYQLASATIQPLTGKLYTFFSTKVGNPNPARRGSCRLTCVCV